MKKIILILVVIGSISVKAKAIRQTSIYKHKLELNNYQDTLYNYLANLNLNNYADKTVDSVLVQLPQNFLQLKIGTCDNLRYACFLEVCYANNISVWIYVLKYEYMNPRR